MTNVTTESIACRAHIKACEGMRLHAYRCPAGVLTIGYGHTKGVREGQVITVAQADSLLDEDLKPIRRYLNTKFAGLTQGQFDALTDFIFNLGVTSFEGSTLCKKIRANRLDPTIKDEFGRWTYAGKKQLDGLVRRRKWEATVWEQKDK